MGLVGGESTFTTSPAEAGVGFVTVADGVSTPPRLVELLVRRLVDAVDVTTLSLAALNTGVGAADVVGVD